MARVAAMVACVCLALPAHDIITTKVTWDREISRLIEGRCTSCHRDGGSAFSLATYEEARPWAKAIKEEVLERRMPPFGAVKGFGDLRDDRSLTQEQIELITSWVEGGAPEGDAALLPKNPDLNPAPPPTPRGGSEWVVEGSRVLARAMTFGGIQPKTLPEGSSARVVARKPDGSVVPLLWVYRYRGKFARTYYFREPLRLPAGTTITASAGSVALLAGTTEPAHPRIVAKTAPAAAAALGDYVCPMDPEVRSPQPGKCPRCGMTLVPGIPDQSEYPLELTTTPAAIRAGEEVQLHFTLRDPKSGAIVKNFEIMHEKLFHMFIVSGDLKYFLHDHPVLQPDGSFVFDEVFPKPGMYRVVADVYPSAGTPQLIPRTLFVGEAGATDAAPLKPDTSPEHGANTDVSLTTDPARPIAGIKTHLFFRLATAEGLEKYLGAWAHMLISSDDTIDLIHEHPFIADGGPDMQFDIVFPRARTYRVWMQFERKGVVNTIAVNVPVITLEQSAR